VTAIGCGNGESRANRPGLLSLVRGLLRLSPFPFPFPWKKKRSKKKTKPTRPDHATVHANVCALVERAQTQALDLALDLHPCLSQDWSVAKGKARANSGRPEDRARKERAGEPGSGKGPRNQQAANRHAEEEGREVGTADHSAAVGAPPTRRVLAYGPVPGRDPRNATAREIACCVGSRAVAYVRRRTRSRTEFFDSLCDDFDLGCCPSCCHGDTGNRGSDR
jgi:hypothetical protein